MGHVIRTLTADKDCDFDEILLEINEEAHHFSDHHDPSAFGAIARAKPVLCNREAAEAYLMENRPAYTAMAVRFHDTEQVDSKRVSYLEKKLRDAETALTGYKASHRVCDRKAAYVTCPVCGSKVSTKHMVRRTRCPVCDRGELRSASAIKAIERLAEARDQIEAQLKAERDRLGDKAPVCWLVQCEYHC